MATYIVETEITDYLIKSVKEDAGEFTTFINTYLDRADKWYIDTALKFGVVEADIVTYAQGQKYKIIELLRVFVYIEALKDLYSINLIADDDYFKKLDAYRKDFDAIYGSLTREMILGEDPVIDVTNLTGQRVTLQADLYNTTSTESEF